MAEEGYKVHAVAAKVQHWSMLLCGSLAAARMVKFRRDQEISCGMRSPVRVRLVVEFTTSYSPSSSGSMAYTARPVARAHDPNNLNCVLSRQYSSHKPTIQKVKLKRWYLVP